MPEGAALADGQAEDQSQPDTAARLVAQLLRQAFEEIQAHMGDCLWPLPWGAYQARLPQSEPSCKSCHSAYMHWILPVHQVHKCTEALRESLQPPHTPPSDNRGWVTQTDQLKNYH